MATWLSWCHRHDGPGWKQGYPGIPGRSLQQVDGDMKHSAEGSYTQLLQIIQNSPRQASWHFSVAKNGTTAQHYPLESITWHCGVKGTLSTHDEIVGNVGLVGIEHAGFAGETLTAPQITATVRLTEDIRARCAAGVHPPELARNLWEHNWLRNTACPSNRIPWPIIINALNAVPTPPAPTPPPPVEEDDMKYVAFPPHKAIYALTGGELVHVPNPPVMIYQVGTTWPHEQHNVNDADPKKKAIARALADLPTHFGKLPQALGGV